MVRKTFTVDLDNIYSHLELAWEPGREPHDVMIVRWEPDSDAPPWAAIIIKWAREEFGEQVIRACLEAHELHEDSVRLRGDELCELIHLQDIERWKGVL